MDSSQILSETHENVHISVAVIIYVTCALSIIGSLLIISTYSFFRELRTNVRLILFHLSIMDLGIGLSNLIGTAAAEKMSNGLCPAQALFAVSSTYGSVLWTNCLAVYLYFIVVYCMDKKPAVYLLRFFLVFCYLMPLILTLWLLLTNKLGRAEQYDSGGWCAIKDVDRVTWRHIYFVDSFGYDMWIYITFVLVPILFIGTRAHISLKVFYNQCWRSC